MEKSRRKALKKLGLAVGIAYVAPQLLTISQAEAGRGGQNDGNGHDGDNPGKGHDGGNPGKGHNGGGPSGSPGPGPGPGPDPGPGPGGGTSSDGGDRHHDPYCRTANRFLRGKECPPVSKKRRYLR